MLERRMEEAIARCPDLFIEAGLTLERRQVVINGRRPDLLFNDSLSRHLLVEIQAGRLDEDHLQRHFYYFYDYRAKYPSHNLRLMFIANRLAPQHKDFLDEHGYEYREYPEKEFERKVDSCEALHAPTPEVLIVTTPGVLAPATYNLLYEIERQPMTLCYKMLLLLLTAELADASGAIPLSIAAARFQTFFIDRGSRNKTEENPKRVRPESLSRRTLSEWERVIRDQPVHYLTESFVINEGSIIRWAPRIRSEWNAELKREIEYACRDRLVRYFNSHVPGGY